jgi:hypothetical protein
MRPGKVIRIGSGSACAEDRLDPSVEMITKVVDLNYICFDSLSENELSIVAMNKMKNHDVKGYDLFLEKRIDKILKLCLERGVKLIGNMGSSNPIAAAEYVVDCISKLGYKGVKVAAIHGDNILTMMQGSEFLTVEEGKCVKEFGKNLIAANAYIGSQQITEALENGAQIILTGRVGDACLFCGALAYEFGWWKNGGDLDKLAAGIMVGHMLECGSQASGGCYADPPYKVVPNAHRIGFPYAEVHENGDIYITKPEGTGGLVDIDVCKEQALYEVHDPANYIEPDIVVDMSGVNFEQAGIDRVKITGTIKGKPPTSTYKVSLGVFEGYKGNITTYYGGPGALTRAQYARDMLYQRFEYLGLKLKTLRIFIIGVDGMYERGLGVPKNIEPWEVGLRTAVTAESYNDVMTVLCEGGGVLAINGPASASCEQRLQDAKEIVGYYHTLIPKDMVKPQISYLEVK